jgi:RNA polymerase sigma-70 factor (ECF subfamily)
MRGADTGIAMTDIDREVVRRAAAGDLPAFEQIVKTYAGGIQATAARILGNREDARDAAQEVFLRLYRFLPGYNARRPFGPWLYKIVVNVSYDFAKRAKRYGKEVSLNDIHTSQMPTTNPGGVAADETHEKVLGMTEKLTMGQRTAFILRDVEGFACGEIADIMDCSPATVRSHLHQARARLRDLIRRHYPELLEGRRNELS